MPAFYCKAVHSEGNALDEVREADSMERLVFDLQNEGYVPIHVVPANSLLGYFRSGSRQKLKNKHILVFTQELATLLQAGLAMDASLKTMLDLTEDWPMLHAVIGRLLKKMKQGMALSDALEQQSCGFSRFYIGIVRAGEAGGDVGQALQHLSEYLERVEALRSTVVSALVYPSILLLTSIASIVLLMTLVLPQFAELFETSGKALPLPTLVVMSASHALQSYWWLLLLVLLGAGLVMQSVLQTSHLRMRWDRKCLRFPLVGELVQKIEVTRFSYTLGSLLTRGVPLLDALTIVQSTINNRVIAETMGTARQNLKQGRTMSSALEADHLFPKLAVQMIKLGEETGKLPEMLNKLSATFDQEVKASVQRLLSLFEPVLILGLGVIIALIIFSVLMAVVSLNDFAF